MKYPIIVPAYYYFPRKPDDVLIFLAGPVLGGGDWQEEFFHILCSQTAWTASFREKMLPRLKVIIPCRWDKDHKFATNFPEVFEISRTGDKFTDSQTVWEISHLKEIVCYENGFIVFGLFPESKDNPRSDGNPYARDTYGEIARYTSIANFKHSTGSILVGYDERFPGIDVIKRNLQYFLPEKWNSNNLRDALSPTHLALWVADKIMRRYANT